MLLLDFCLVFFRKETEPNVVPSRFGLGSCFDLRNRFGIGLESVWNKSFRYSSICARELGSLF